MKPANFPERKRQRQLGALARLKPIKGTDNWHEYLTLIDRTALSQRSVRTKKYRGGTAAAKFARVQS